MHGEAAHLGRTPELSSAVATLLPAGSCLIVTGPAGIGKTHFARQAARILREDAPVEVVRIRGSWGARSTPYHAFTGLIPALLHDEFPTPIAALESVTDVLVRPGEDVLLIADDAHEYDAASLELLGALAVAPGLRVIITARSVPGDALWLLERLERDGYAAHQRLGPLSLAESSQLACSLFQSEAIEEPSALQLHSKSGGNPLLLSRYAAALLRSGAITVSGPLAYWNGAAPLAGTVAELFATELHQLSPAERSALLAIALAEPMPEAIARRLCDAEALDSLARSSFITLAHDQSEPRFSIVHPLIAEAVRDAATPGERVSADLAFLDALPPVIPEHAPELALRSVAISIEHGQPIRLSLLRRAFTIACAAADRPLAVRLADLLIEHPSSTLFERLDARARRLRMMRSVDLKRYRATSVQDELRWTTPQPGDDDALLMRRVALAFAVFDLLLRRDDDPAQALLVARTLHAQLPPDALPVHEYFALKLTPRLGTIGHFDEAMALDETPQVSTTSRVSRLTSAAVRCAILGQQGKVSQAREIAIRELPLATLHLPDVPDAVGELFASWYLIASVSGRIQTISNLQRSLDAHLEQRPAKFLTEAGFSEMTAGVLASAQGQWQVASGQFAAAIARLEISDPVGYLVNVSAAAAFAYAAAGNSAAARAEIERCLSLPLGESRIVEGIIRFNLVRARLWLGDRQLAAAGAGELAQWARERHFSLVELRALHVQVLAGERDPALLARAEILRPQIDGRIAPAIVDHIRALHEQERLSEHPSTRALARLGIWMPLPAGTDLTGREREIANFASLGYSSKWIGTTLQISRRTVETHLAHLYLKLGVTERDSLADRLCELSEQAELTLWRAA